MINVSQQFHQKLYELGYKRLTPIQERAIPKILEGKNTLVIAPTGFGKTETAVFPVFYEILKESPPRISAIYITPLRALNRDIENRLKRIGDAVGVKVSVRHGDSSQSERRNVIKTPPDLLLTTPETLMYLVVNKDMRELLKNLQWVIIDELQEMLDEKRGYELLLVLERLKRLAHRRIQLIGLSATIGDVEVAKKFLGEDVEVVKIDKRKEMKISLVIPNINEEIIDLSVKTGLNPETLARIKKLEDIIREDKPVLIFTNVRETTEFLANELSKLTNLKILTHHGSLSKEIRVEAESKFRNGEIDALVATSSLELGIDIGLINAVVQYMSPRQVIRLVQRIGRSGHSLDRVSKGYLIPSGDIYDILECKSILDSLGEGYLEKPVIEPKPYDVIAHEIAGLVLEGVTDIKEIHKIITSSFLFSQLTEEELERILSILEAARIIKRDKSMLSPSYRIWRYYYTTNMIPDSIRDYLVIDHVTNSKIGTLDYEFVATLDEDSIIVLGGRLWKIISIEENKVYVEQTSLKSGVLPSWFGESIPVEKEVANRVYEYLEKIQKGENIDLPESVVERLKSLVEEQRNRGYPLPSRDTVLVEINGDILVVHVALGTRGNNTLGAVLSLLLTNIKGVKTNFRADAYHIAVASVVPLTEEDVRKAVLTLNSITTEEFKNLIERAIRESPQYKWKLLIEAERFGVIDKDKISDLQISQTVLRAFSDTVIGEEAVKELLYKNYDITVFDYLKDFSWKIIQVPNFSPLAKEFLNRLLVLSHSEDKGAMLEIFKRKLNNCEVWISCLLCGWNKKFTSKNAPQKCEKCGSIFLTVIDGDEDLKILKKARENQRMSKKESKRLETLRSIASMYSTYNKYVAIGLCARGVGINNLGKVLNNLKDNEDKFYEALLNEERKFLKNRKYWQ
ncbi:DEAD/DEAH box helicase [Stygiolobus caldivivus]|uniref:Helicase n=1 Tax=Stygiolobus caldivivus TaxID=2824673 RepID=A0A8D5U6W3_9CREN|nr:DEAD/DEAH box helicase [Stygiolobus caldivivus]BCU70676.1 helicase [Stygiolobus caldivivus]